MTISSGAWAFDPPRDYRPLVTGRPCAFCGETITDTEGPRRGVVLRDPAFVYRDGRAHLGCLDRTLDDPEPRVY
jgi:hypothetical protein